MNNNKIIYLFFLLLILFLLVIGGCTSETVVEEYDISGIIIDQNGEKLKNYTDITIYIHGDEIEKTVYPADNGSWTSTVKGQVVVTPMSYSYSFEPSNYDDVNKKRNDLDFTATLRKVTEVEINIGRDLIYIARERGGEIKYLYEANVLDQKGNAMENEEIEWKLAEAPEAGIYIDKISENKGEITIHWDAVPEEFEIIATSKSNSDISASMTVNMAYLSKRENNVYADAFENLDDKMEKLNLAEVEEDFKLPETIKGYDSATGEDIIFDIIWESSDHAAIVIEGNTALIEQSFQDIVGSINAFIQPIESAPLTQNIEDPREKDYTVTVCSLNKDLEGLIYNVSIRPNQQGHVEVLLQDINRNSVEFWMHDRNNYSNNAFIDNISNIKAIGENNQKLNVELVTVENEKRLRVQTENNSKFVLSYDFPVKKRDVGEIVESAAAFNNKAIFAVPDITLNNVYVNYDLPIGWEAVTHFTPIKDGLFKVEKIPDLSTDMLENVTKFGVVEYKVEKQISGIDYIFVVLESSRNNCGLIEFWKSDYGTTPEEEMKIYIDYISESVEFFRDVFGFWPGGNRYLISTLITEVEYLHMNHGFKYEMQPWTRNRRADVPHHVAHAWIWSKPINLNNEEHALIMEGIPTFYQSELTTDIYNDDKWRGLNYFHYLCLKRAEHFDLRDKETIKTYAQSHMQILALDRLIKNETNGTKNIDDLMALLGQRFGKKGEYFYRQDLINAINDLTNTNITDFYMDYLAGGVSKNMPPVEDFIDEYKETFFKWLDTYDVRYGSDVKFLRTMVLIQLEIGLHSKNVHETEHNTSGRVGLYLLDEFRQEILKYDKPLNEQKVKETLSLITGVDQSDFFDFYTIGEFRPSVSHIEEWLNAY